MTPNSFSDGNQFNNISSFIEQIRYLKSYGVRIFDFGAESTAPFNDPIESSVERSRYESIFFKALDQNQRLFKDSDILSFDTYRPQTMIWIIEQLSRRSIDCELWFNDVSGKVDSHLLDFFENPLVTKLIEADKFRYILSHNLCPDRLQTSSHMDFVSPSISWDEIHKYFETKMAKLSEVAKRSVILDPCFGFSKSVEQNQKLLAEVRDRNVQLLDFPYLIGLSRKSFFKALKTTDSDDFVEVELLHIVALRDFAHLGAKTYFRLHDPRVSLQLENYLSF